MAEWTFLDYLDSDGGNPIREWITDKRCVPTKARAKIQRILLQLTGEKLWVRPLASNLDGYDPIVEIRIRWMNTPYRILGFRGPEDRKFTILYPAIEKGDRFVPENAPTIALNRMREVLRSAKERVCEHRFN